MSDALLALLPDWGPLLIGLATFLSCLALPLPTSLMMLAAGAFAAAGDLVLAQVAGSALAGAVLGDLAGFALGRGGGRGLTGLVRRRPGRAALLSRARDFTASRGGLGVFLSRWLFSALGPYVNFVAGATGLPWRRFVPAAVAGEAVWVGLYTGAGWLFADRIAQVAALAANLSGALAAGLAAAILGRALLRAARDRRRVSPSGATTGTGTGSPSPHAPP